MAFGSRIRIAAHAVLSLKISFLSCSGSRAQSVPPYRDQKLSIDQRVADLLSRMTLEEKIAQLEGAWENRQFFTDPSALFVNEKKEFVPERAAVLPQPGYAPSGGAGYV